jgi:predicted O-linked N-acetylglucosamine transferase (SPINDLY family)
VIDPSNNREFKDDLKAKVKDHITYSHWISISGCSSISMIDMLQLDVLIFGDLLMSSATALCAMQRVAPVQIGFWGHPYTSGFDSIDYFISSDLFESALSIKSKSLFAVESYSEQLVRFDSLSATFLRGRDETENKIEILFTRLDYWKWILQNGKDLFERRISTVLSMDMSDISSSSHVI